MVLGEHSARRGGWAKRIEVKNVILVDDNRGVSIPAGDAYTETALGMANGTDVCHSFQVAIPDEVELQTATAGIPPNTKCMFIGTKFGDKPRPRLSNT
jgi:hypothetical protein